MDENDAKFFLNKQVNVFILENGSEFIYYGQIVSISNNSIVLFNKRFGNSLLSLDAIQKIVERGNKYD